MTGSNTCLIQSYFNHEAGKHAFPIFHSASRHSAQSTILNHYPLFRLNKLLTTYSTFIQKSSIITNNILNNNKNNSRNAELLNDH